ncbi:metabotropic glutamate receptor-like protein P [Coccinella septempunctata]|uniref:metabotropic glutamate receptor-like protein P n=1 Tax=Coccinella septempunctata TaxID=41139 RepID=UPI001D07117D|nr:metabotropic glutamate receptor-like protein P [Coccinella septempunctata]
MFTVVWHVCENSVKISPQVYIDHFRCTSRASIYNFTEPATVPAKIKSEINKNTSNKLNIYQKVLLDSKITNSTYKFSNENTEGMNEYKNDMDTKLNNNETSSEKKQNVLETDSKLSTVVQKLPDNKDLIEFNKHSNFLNKIIPFINKDDISVISDILLADNSKDLIRFEDVKATDQINDNENFNSSLNSLTSENFSSPMQTSTDMILDSEVLSTDIASNDSQSPKNKQPDIPKNKNFSYIANFAHLNESTESLCNPKSDQSLLNSDESCDSSPLHKNKRGYRKQRKHKKKYFGVKTLQSIFNKHDGYSDVSTTASDYEEEKDKTAVPEIQKDKEKSEEEAENSTIYKCKAIYTDTSPQFEENVHNILSDIFIKNFPNTHVETVVPNVQKPIGSKKYFSLHGQNLRVGKALRLCPNENIDLGNDQRKEKLLASTFTS